MKFLVTGGTGFIGHNVVRFLTEMGHDCVVADNGTDYGFIPYDELNYLITNRVDRLGSVTNYLCDICSITGMERIFNENQIDSVIHLASFPRQKVVANNPLEASQVMSTGLVNLLEHTSKYKINRFVYISSSMVYGDFDDNVKESVICAPQGQYAIFKYMGEKLVEDYAIRNNFQSIIVRPSAVYGDWDVEDRVVSKFMLAAIRGDKLIVRGPHEKLDFTYVTDAARGIALAATTNLNQNKIYNITRSADHTLSLFEAAQTIIDIVGSGQIQVHDRDLAFPRRGRLCIDQAVNDLGYQPVIDAARGFELYYKWFLQSTYWQRKLNADTICRSN